MSTEIARKFLDAHEDDRQQPADEKAMDLSNNGLALKVADKLLKSGGIEDKQALSEMASALKTKELIVLDRRHQDWRLK